MTSYVLRDLFTTARSAGAVNGTDAEPGPGTRTVTDVESNISIVNGQLRGLTQPTSAVWGDAKVVWSSVARAQGRALIGLITPDDPLSDLAFGFATATNITDPQADGLGWLVKERGQYVISNGLNYVIDNNNYGGATGVFSARKMQYLIVIVLNGIGGGYVLVSTIDDDTGGGISGPIGWYGYPNARLIHVSDNFSTDPVYPYISGYDNVDVYPLYHSLRDLRVIDLPAPFDTEDGLATFIDRCNRADSNTTIGTGWTNQAGVFGISSNKIYPVSGSGFMMAWASAGRADGIFKFRLTVPSDWNGSNYLFGVMLRRVDNNNYLRLWNNGGNNLLLQIWSGGGYAGQITAGAYTWVAGQEYEITVYAYGNQYMIAIDDVWFTADWVTDAGSYHLAGTGFGPYGANFGGTSIRWDDFASYPFEVELPTDISDGDYPTRLTPDPVLITDTFTDTNGVRLPNHTPDVAPAGSAWEEAAGQFEITGNTATMSSPDETWGNYALIDCGQNNYEISVDITLDNPLGDWIFGGIVCRASSSPLLNHLVIRLAAGVVAQPYDHEIEMAPTLEATSEVSSKTQMKVEYAAGGTYNLKIQVYKDICNIYLDDLPRGTFIIPAALALGSKVGIYRAAEDESVVSFNNFSVSTIDSITAITEKTLDGITVSAIGELNAGVLSALTVKTKSRLDSLEVDR